MKCFADKGDECRVLSVKKCDGCNFYATPEQAERSRRESYKRRKKLGGPFTEYDKVYQKQEKI